MFTFLSLIILSWTIIDPYKHTQDEKKEAGTDALLHCYQNLPYFHSPKSGPGFYIFKFLKLEWLLSNLLTNHKVEWQISHLLIESFHYRSPNASKVWKVILQTADVVQIIRITNTHLQHWFWLPGDIFSARLPCNSAYCVLLLQKRQLGKKSKSKNQTSTWSLLHISILSITHLSFCSKLKMPASKQQCLTNFFMKIQDRKQWARTCQPQPFRPTKSTILFLFHSTV